MSKLPVSVHVLTWNSSKTLERCLVSVRDCAEILVIDGGSTDGTAEIAERCGATVIPQRFPGAQGKPLADFAAARNEAMRHAGQPWILSLDSDEQMEPEAIGELLRATEDATGPGAYLVPRHYVLPDGRRVDQASTYPNERVYFFRRDAVLHWQKPVHERIALKPGTVTGRLERGTLAPLAPLSVFKAKLARYLLIEVESSRGTGWNRWLRRVMHTARSRMIAIVRLLQIRVMRKPGVRLPMKYEMARFWYAWKLVVMTCPLSKRMRG